MKKETQQILNELNHWTKEAEELRNGKWRLKKDDRYVSRCPCGGEIKHTNITGDMECEICDKSY